MKFDFVFSEALSPLFAPSFSILLKFSVLLIIPIATFIFHSQSASGAPDQAKSGTSLSRLDTTDEATASSGPKTSRGCYPCGRDH